MTKKSDCTFVIVSSYDNTDTLLWGPYATRADASRDLLELMPTFQRNTHWREASVEQCARPLTHKA